MDCIDPALLVAKPDLSVLVARLQDVESDPIHRPGSEKCEIQLQRRRSWIIFVFFGALARRQDASFNDPAPSMEEPDPL